jgi:glycine hydroxymethyltransferase
LPGKRYYGGCEVVDKVEQLAIDRAKQLFGADHANVQPHSGASANAAVFLAFMKPGETFLGMDLSQGGHLTHGSPVNFSGLLYNAVSYGVTGDGIIDYDHMRAQAREHKPKIIIAGYSAYSRVIDWQAFADIAKEVGALFWVDMAHFAGLAATGAYPSPVPFADVVTSTTHKTLRGPRGGIILCKAEHAKAIDKAMFPGMQGGPLEHVIAAKAVAFHEALQPSFAAYCQQVVQNAQVLAAALVQRGYHIVSGGTDNHLMLVDVTPLGIGGKLAEEVLDRCGITCNKNMIPFDERKPMDPSGIRLGTPALTTRGMGTGEMKQIAAWILRVLKSPSDQQLIATTKGDVAELAEQFPVPAAKLDAAVEVAGR